MHFFDAVVVEMTMHVLRPLVTARFVVVVINQGDRKTTLREIIALQVAPLDVFASMVRAKPPSGAI